MQPHQKVKHSHSSTDTDLGPWQLVMNCIADDKPMFIHKNLNLLLDFK